MKQQGRNVAASVQTRLLQLSRNSKLSLQDLLERYCTERLLYRLSRSPHHSRFILKGAMLLIVWGEGSSERVTRDADLLGFGDNSPTSAAAVFRDICAVGVEDDGVHFEVETIEADSKRAEQEYVGVRVTLRARVGNARIPVQADIGFGDAFTQEPEEIEFPTLLDMPKPVLRAYTKETALAEKFEAMVSLGERNTRMKDYFDVWLLARRLFLGVWERINNPGFNSLEFEGIRNEAGRNSFFLSAKKWIDLTGANGLIASAGRYGGTYAHKDIAFEFGSWLSPEFKLYLIKEFQRLKDEENDRLQLSWNLQRTLAKINYRIHTDAIKDTLIPPSVTKAQSSAVYASEAGLYTVAVAGRARAAFNIDRVTKAFYLDFDTHRKAFLKFIGGISEVADCEWYASVMLNHRIL